MYSPKDAPIVLIIKAQLEFKSGLTQGIDCAVGSEVSGWALFIQEDRLHYVHKALKLHYSA
jgi:hypothetical protein